MSNKIKIGNNILNNNFGDIILKMHFTEETTFSFTLKDSYYYDCVVDWGDDSQDKIINSYMENSCTNVISDTYMTAGSEILPNLTPSECYDERIHVYQAGTYYLRITGRCETIAMVGNKNLIEVVSWGDPNITKLSYIRFKGCKNLTKLPNERGGLKFVETFRDSFAKTKISEIPFGIFDYNEIVTDFDSTFYNCELLTKLPNDLFKYNINVTNFDSTFKNCFILPKIPNNLFRYNVNVTNFNSIFVSCNKIKKLPDDLFKYNVNVLSFETSFMGSKIKKLPDELFKYNIMASAFTSCFESCPNLEIISEDLFRYNTSITNLHRIFVGTALKEIPYNLFIYNTSVTDFSEAFYGSDQLTGIAPKLWDNNIWSSATSYINCFDSTGSLGTNGTTIPTSWGGSCSSGINCTGL